MKISRVVAFILLNIFVLPAFAMMPPSYLSVKKWKRCVSTYTKRTAEFVCLPDRKPLECPSRSWEQLTEMSNLPHCPAVDKEGIGASAPVGSARPVSGSAPR